MIQLSVPARLAICLASLTVCVLLFARALGFVPDDRSAVLCGRAKLCESMAVHLSRMANRDDAASMQSALKSIAERNPEIRSIAVRLTDDRLLAEVGSHAADWESLAEDRSTETHIYVPILIDGSVWGVVEASFSPIGDHGWWFSQTGRLVTFSVFVILLCAVTYYFYLRRVLGQLDPQKVIPSRVKMALDTMAEGLLILDGDGNIMLANSAFAETVRISSTELLGQNVDNLKWEKHQPENEEAAFPWKATLEEGKPHLGKIVHFFRAAEPRLTFLVNVTPIHDSEGQSRGALVSFDDITQLEKNKRELHEMVDNLRQSSDEIRRQNRELEQLATRDPLTACFNRRSFFERFNTLWNTAIRHSHPLSCVMVDIDHFKSINDNHGHLVGDQVLQRVGQVLKQTARESDVVCRYGGEEFAVLLPYTNIDAGALAAERIRVGLETAKFSNLSITASLGVSALNFGATDPQDLLDQADQCLFVAKRNGRNQVVRWDNVPEERDVDESKICRSKPEQEQSQSPIPFQAVTALISALAYRDVATAAHSRRVADLCVATGEGLISLSLCYVLENAALLHDIGKIGVPDSILLKPGELTDQEWQVMRRQERIGVEIIRASFDSRELVEIVANHQAWFDGTPHATHLPRGEDIPVGARILNIVNAYDAMTSIQVYREPRTQPEAFAELRRCAGRQFDPELVERFIGMLNARQSFTTPKVSGVSQETALQFGLQIERLMAALDDQDITGLQALAERLHAIAQKHQVSEIADKASELAACSETEHDATKVLHMANELIELCRSTQGCYVRVANDV